MTFIELTAEINTMKEPNADVFKLLSDEEILELNQISAKIELKKDILSAVNLNQNQIEDFEAVIDLNSYTLSIALAYLQCRIYYEVINEVSDQSLTLYRLEQYTKKYNAMKSQFTLLKTFETQPNKTNNIAVVYG